MPQISERFRIDSARLKEWNYSTPWWYYVTINTKNHVSYFGYVMDGKMVLNDLGKIVDVEWLKTKNCAPMLIWIASLLCQIMFME
ncbi:MAG: hypothetical protein Q8L04_15160 [Ignavibacteria bacterium]|nr:hypothetical protein [Ignavibacteria bacterium]